MQSVLTVLKLNVIILCCPLTGATGVQQPAAVEANVVWCGVPAHYGTGKEEVWAHWLEHPVRVQPIRLHCYRTVCAESP